jgi:hypothetical protein
MAPRYRESAVNEMKRILKPTGRAYLSASLGLWTNIGRADWERILEGFRIERRGKGWAVVSTA